MSIYEAALTSRFCEAWRAMVKEVYGYADSGKFLVVPSLSGKKVQSYLPLLNYTDITPAEGDALAASVGRMPYQIRVLNPSYKDFKQDDTVTMRIDLCGGVETVYAGISKRTRRYLKDVERQDLRIDTGSDRGSARKFYTVFQEVMYRLGTPTFPQRLFELLPEHVECRFYISYLQNELAAAAAVIYDEQIAWVPWSGTLSKFLEHRPGLGMYWTAIKDSVLAGKTVFDYGRSGFQAGTYEFKQRWGASPVKIDILSDTLQKPYEKYAQASALWKKLPKPLVDFAGPQLCKYLSDL